NQKDEPRDGPVVSVETLNNAPVITGPLTPSGWVGSASVTFPGDFARDPDGDALTYRYYVQDGAGNQVNADPANSTVAGLVDAATYTWYAVVADGFGGSVTSSPTQFTVDLTPPIVTLSNLSTDWATAHATALTAADATSGVQRILYRWNADPYTEYSGGELAAPEGINTLWAKAVDWAGNESAPVTHVYKVDTSPPVLSQPVISGVTPGTGDPYVGSNTEVFATWEMKDEQVGIASYAWAVVTDPTAPLTLTPGTAVSRDYRYSDVFRTSLADGIKYYLVIEAANSLGLTSRVVSAPFTVDASAPQITNLQLAGPVSVNGALAIDNLAKLSVQVTAEDPQSQVASIDYALLTSPAVDQNTVWVPDLSGLDLAGQPGGRVYYVAVRARNGVGLENIALSPGVLLDKSAPEILSLVDEGVSKREKTSLLVSVQAADAETGVVRYRYAIGTAPGQTDVSALLPGNESGWFSRAAASPNLDILIEGLNLADGTYYVTVEAVNGVGLAARASTDGITIDSSLKPAPVVTDDGAFTSDRRELHIAWTYADAPSISHYAYRVLQRNPADGSLVPLFDWRRQTPSGGLEDLIVTADGPFGLGLAHGVTYLVEVKAVYPDGTESATGRTNGITVDLTPPQNLTIQDGAYAPKEKWVVSWSAADPESGLVGFKYAVGTSRGGMDVTGGLMPVGKATAVTIAPERLAEGGLYFVTVVALNGAGLETQIASDGTLIDSTPPPAPRVLDSGLYTNDATSLSASWTWTAADPESGTAGYEYAVLTERKVTSSTAWTPVGRQTKVTAQGLQLVNGQTYFIAVRATNGAGLTSVGFSDGIVVDVTAPDPPRVDDLVDYTGSKTQLSAVFAAVDLQSGILKYRYSVGTLADPGAVRPLTELSATRVDLTGLQLTEGTVYFFYVEAVNNAGLVSATAMSDGVLVDSGYPVIQAVADEGQFTRSATELFASWTATAPPSGTAAYEYAVVTDRNTTTPAWRSDPANPLLRNVLITGLSLTDGQTYYVLVRGRSTAGNYTPPDKWGRSDGITVDTSPPPPPVVSDAGAFTAQTLRVHFEAQDPHSGIAGYRYAVGTTRGGWEITGDWLTYPSTESRVDLELADLPLVHGKTYYVSVKARNGACDWSEAGRTDGITADLTPPVTPVVTYPGGYVRSRTTLLGLTWQSGDPETGVVAYRYGLTTDPAQPVFGPETPYSAAQGTLNLTNLNLAEGATYYVAVQTRNGVGVWSAAGLSAGIKVDTIAPTVTFAAAGKELVTNSGQLELAWSTDEAGRFSATVTRPNGTTWTTEGEVAAGTHTLAVSEALEGKYTVRLQVTDAAGTPSAVAEQPFRLNAKPRVNAGLDLTVCKGEPFTFKAQATDPDGTIAAYQWDFGDGTAPVEEAEPTHAFTQLGTYTVTLTVTDNDGGTGTGTVKVTVTNTHAGTLYLDETWDTPWTVTGEVIVPAGLTLTIAAGTEVTFQEGTGLTVQGRLVVAGEDGKPVTLAGATSKPGFWKGVTLSHSTAGNSLAWATLRDAQRGLAVVGSPAAVTRVTFRGNEIGLHAYAASPAIDASAFLDNTVYGLKEDAGADPTVTNSQFAGNRAGPYYDEVETIISVERLNELGANAGNF
ncbi:MAG TPA: PKD domain-containing protein, partial [Firmicutes bacterium]|nr:PKD domain-containing protein [Bacillota bacterium]